MLNNILAFLFISSTLFATEFQLPQEFTISEHTFSLTSKFTIATDEKEFAYVSREFLSFPPKFGLYDTQDQLLSKAKMHWAFLAKVSFDITDENDNKIASILPYTFTLLTKIDVVNPNNELIAVVKGNFLTTELIISDPETSEVMAIMTRPFFRLFSDTWTMHVLNPDLIEAKGLKPEHFIMLSVVQSNVDHWKQQAAAQQTRKTAALALPNESKFIAVQSSESAPSEYFDAQLEEKLDSYAHKFKGREPSAEDFETIDNLVVKFFDEEHGGIKMSTGRSGQLIDLSRLVPLLDDDKLTVNQQAALYMLIRSKLDVVEDMTKE
ncbi:MAG: hypothetical protein Q8K75_07195 [Chlamydiales bacterium]|nr:hypothetical protein [Chlamydiales bacterium]